MISQKKKKQKDDNQATIIYPQGVGLKDSKLDRRPTAIGWKSNFGKFFQIIFFCFPLACSIPSLQAAITCHRDPPPALVFCIFDPTNFSRTGTSATKSATPVHLSNESFWYTNHFRLPATKGQGLTQISFRINCSIPAFRFHPDSVTGKKFVNKPTNNVKPD